MEVEKRKKRVIGKVVVEEEEEEERERLKKLKGKEPAGGSASGDAEAMVVPTEEEVDEFFAILRRMKVAVKYFDEKGRGGKEWREALEQAELTVDDDGDAGGVAEQKKKKKKKGGEVMINEGFDLNAVAPEATESGGA